MRRGDLYFRIEKWTNGSKTLDGFGGSTVEAPSLVSTHWCNIRKMKPGEVKQTLGGRIDTQTLEITVRRDVDINPNTNFIKYLGEKYTITTAMVEVDRNFLVFNATKSER